MCKCLPMTVVVSATAATRASSLRPCAYCRASYRTIAISITRRFGVAGPVVGVAARQPLAPDLSAATSAAVARISLGSLPID